MSSAGSTTGVLLQDYLQGAGVGLDQVRLVPLGNQSAQAQSFVTGQVAAFICGPPVTQSVLAKRKGSKVLADLSSKYRWNGAGLVGYMPWVQSHKGTTTKVVKALREAWTAWKTSPDAAQATIVRAGRVSGAAAKAAYEGSLKVMSEDFAPSADIEQSVLDVLAKHLPSTKRLNANDMVEPAFAG
jgi:ABC-type nitrate/sulfonate/bicarbonate transport system substrate-binding protein